MQTYDGKVSYFTLAEPMIGIIIADPHIYQMRCALFEHTWNDPRAFAPQAAARTGSDADADSSTMSQVGTP